MGRGGGGLGGACSAVSRQSRQGDGIDSRQYRQVTADLRLDQLSAGRRQ